MFDQQFTSDWGLRRPYGEGAMERALWRGHYGEGTMERALWRGHYGEGTMERALIGGTCPPKQNFDVFWSSKKTFKFSFHKLPC